MTSASAAAWALLALSGGTLGHGAVLERVDPATLRPSGPAVRLPGDAFGVSWARHGTTLAIVTKPTGGLGFPIRLIRSDDLRVLARVAVGKRDVCGLTFSGETLVALASTRLCYQRGGSFSLLRVDLRRHRIVSAVAVPKLLIAAPTNLAFGDGRAYVTGAGGGIDAIDLGTGTVTRHRPRRTLAKGEGIVWAHWLGGHLLGAGPAVIDVRTWRSRTLEAGATGIVPAGSELAAYGARGVALYTRSGRFRARVTTIPTYAGVTTVRGRLYVGSATVFDLATRRFVRTAGSFDLLLAP